MSLFSRLEIESTAITGYKSYEGGPICASCKLYLKCNSPRMKHTGDGRLEALVIAEAPGKSEDQTGKQLIGKAGKLFRDKLTEKGVNLDRDFWKINAVNCWPHKEGGENRTPTSSEISYCRPLVLNTIEKLKPKFIFLLGKSAVESLYGGKESIETMAKWRGLLIPNREHNCWIYCMYHPSSYNRNEFDKNYKASWDRDLDIGIKLLRSKQERPLFDNESKRVKILYKYEDVINILDKILDTLPPDFYFDYETTGIKPHIKGHKIAAMSFCTSPDEAFSFPLQYRTYWDKQQFTEIKKRVRKILQNHLINKSAHNINFENSWSKNILGAEVNRWHWDTKIAAHILDNRRDFTGLKFQALIEFGIEDYSSHLDKYLKSTNQGQFNQIDKAPLDDLLLYNGMDSLIGYKLMKRQTEKFLKLPKGVHEAFNFFMDGQEVLSEMHENGIPADELYYSTYYHELGEEIKELRREILKNDGARVFEEKLGREIDIGSSKDLGVLFYDILKSTVQLTKSEKNRSVDEKALHNIKSEFATSILHIRKKEKVRNTYIAQFLREIAHDKIHPVPNLNTAISFRSSAFQPNFQNIPVRDEEAKKVTRGGLIPPKGWQIMEADFSSLEVCISCCYHKDPNMINYVTNPVSDMHRDTGMDIWKLPIHQMTKDIRFYAKNEMVFPEFYGSYYANCARDLWKCVTERNLKIANGRSLIEHCREIGIKDYTDFEEHLKEVEDIFWNKRFRAYKEWKEKINQRYRRDGYITSHMGFVYQGYIEFKKVTNYLIQGTAFHVLLWTVIQINRELKRRKMRSKLVGQIHDSAVSVNPPEEIVEYAALVKEIAEVKTRERFPWIIVPLGVEFEIAGIDKPWSEKKEYK